MSFPRSICTASAALVLTAALTACAPKTDPDTAASPVQTMIRTQERLQDGITPSGGVSVPIGEDGTVRAKVLAPAPLVWDALLAGLNARKINLTILDRGAGRMGDTSLVLLRRFNNKSLSYYLNCGTSMTGNRADEDRIRGDFLVQISRLRGDTVGIGVHFAGAATSMSGSSSGPQACVSSGRAENELIDEVIQHTGGAGRR